MTSNLPETPENHEDSSEDEPLYELTAQEFAERFSTAPHLDKKDKKKSPLPFAPDWLGIDWVIFNTHVGMGIRNGGLTWILKNWLPDVVLMQEVKNVNLDRFEDEWHVVYYERNAILARKSVFIMVESGGPDIRFGSQYNRNRVYAVLLHKTLKRVFYVQDVHLDPLYGQPDLSKVRDQARLRQHILQGNTYTDWARKRSEDRGAVHGHGGDFNELVDIKHLSKKDYFRSMSMAHKFSIMNIFPSFQLAAKKTGPVRIDEIFFNDTWYLDVTNRDSINLRKKFKGLDHNTVRVRTRVRPRRKWSKSAQKMMSNLP